MWDHVLEAEKGKISAESEKGGVKKELQACQTKLATAEDMLRDAEIQKRILKMKAQISKDDADKPLYMMEQENMWLSASNTELRLQLKMSKEKEQKLKEELAVQEERVATLHAELERRRREREEEEIASHKCQLSDTRRQQQLAKEEYNTTESVNNVL